MKKIAINASNLHVGGGVQVACSFLHEISISDFILENFYFFVSTTVDENLQSLKSPIRNHRNYKVTNVYGLKALLSPLNKSLTEFDLVFTVFGPSYFLGLKGITVEGFAQSWIIDKGCYNILSKKNAVKLYFKLLIQKQFFKRPDMLIVELEHVRDSLIKAGWIKKEDIDVVHNTVGSIYSNPSKWEPINFKSASENVFTLGYLTRDYAHKNAKILPDVKYVLKEEYGLDVEFVVTFTEKEWLSNTQEFQLSITNAGPLKISQCPSFYNEIDAVIFPSLMECFSATPLEAMAMEKPLFSSDRRFVSDVCGEHAYYFDPCDANSVASVIANYIYNIKGKDSKEIKKAKELAQNFSAPNSRAVKYMNIINSFT